MKKQLTVITGGAGGMGKAIAKKIGPEYDLVLADRSEEALTKAVEELTALGITAQQGVFAPLTLSARRSCRFF